MHKKALLFLSLFSFVTIVLAQDYQISFGILGIEETPDSVSVTNLNQNTHLDLSGSDVLHLVGEVVGITENALANQGIKVYPNPVVDRAYIEFYNPYDGMVQVYLSDIAGKLMELQSGNLPQGFSTLEVSGLGKGTYVLRVQGTDYYYTALLIASGSSDKQTASYLSPVQSRGSSLKTAYSNQETIQMQYNDGEQLLFRAYKSSIQAEVTLIPAGNYIVKFDFSPEVDFTADVTDITAGSSVQFTDSSANSPTGWMWDFGDGGTSIEQHPNHTYNTEGSYTVKLKATNDYGSDTETKTLYITVYALIIEPLAEFTASATTITVGESIQFTDQSTNDPTGWSWDFGDGGTSTDQSPSHIYTSAGTYTVSLTATNSAGEDSEIKSSYITVNESLEAPVLLSTEPEVGYAPILPLDGSVVLVFDKAVLYDESKDLIFSEFYDGEDVVAGSVTVDFNEVTVTLGEELTNRDYALLSYPEGAFVDYSGNPTAEMDSYLDWGGGMFVGLYWRAVGKEFEAISLAPEEGVVGTSAFDIVVTFAEEVSAAGVNDGDITLTYDDGLEVQVKDVLASEVSATGNDLTIAMSTAPLPGMTITLNIPAGALEIGYHNPNAKFTATWHTEPPVLSDLVGNYTVSAVSYISPGAYDEVWNATVELVPGNDTALSISIDAGSGGGIAFLATVDLDAMTITISPGTDAGNLYGYGATIMVESDGATYINGAADLVGTIFGSNSFTIDLLGMFLSEYDNGDGTYGAVWDAFNTTWTKTKPVLSDLAGNYTVDAQSYGDPGNWDEVWTATVELVPDSDTSLSITIDAGAGGGIPFLVTVDEDSKTFTIPAGTNAGNLYGYGATTIIESDGQTYIDLSTDLIGNISDAGSFTIDLLGMYFPDYDLGDGTYGALWDAFNTTWTKTATKAAVSGDIHTSKSERFK